MAKTTSEADLRAITIGEPRKLDGKITLADYDPLWPKQFEREAARIRGALGAEALMIEHVGSTSVPGLCAKPIIDIVLAVARSNEEAAYVPALEGQGYVLRIREPDWFEHRLLKGPDTEVNLHVFSAGCAEIETMLRFRDWLRASDADRDRYAHVKRELAAQDWTFTQNYADAKSEVIAEIMARAQVKR